MSIVRRDDRSVLAREPQVPTPQHLVNRASGSNAMTVLIATFPGGEAVPSTPGQHLRWAPGGRVPATRDHQTGGQSNSLWRRAVT